MAATSTGTRRESTAFRDAMPVVAFVAGIAYLLLLLLPLLDTAFNPLTAHPEDYVTGRFGIAVNLSYAALAVAIATLILALLPVRGWSILGVVLLLPVAVISVPLAVDPVGFVRGNDWLALPIAALALAPLIVTLTLRERFQAGLRAVGGVAIATLVAFAALALAPDAISGLVNRVFDLLIAAWIAVTAWALWHRGPA